MSLWPENEFQRVGISTKLSQRTLAACRDVLVDGLSGVEAADKHGVKTSQISRGLGVLRDRREEISKSAKMLKREGQVLRLAAAEVAKHIAGDGLEIVDAKVGNSYEGKIIVNTQGYMVQQQGRLGVMHHLGNLEKMPTMNVLLTIHYPKEGGKALVRDSLSAEQGKSLSR